MSFCFVRRVVRLDQSNVFVLASKAETFGVVVIEAMARAIPVISSDIAGTREIINESNGILFREGDQSALTESMKNMVRNYDIYQPAKIRDEIKTRFGPDAVKNGLFIEND